MGGMTLRLPREREREREKNDLFHETDIFGPGDEMIKQSKKAFYEHAWESKSSNIEEWAVEPKFGKLKCVFVCERLPSELT